MTKELAPVVLFVYNRSVHTGKTLEALAENPDAERSVLYIYADGPKPGISQAGLENIGRVRELIRSRKWCGEVKVIERDRNLGLASSVISGVTEVIGRHGKAIVLEDDIVTSSYFLRFMNGALDGYESDKRIMSIGAYNYPKKLLKMPVDYRHDLFLSHRNTSWGWATWKDRWEMVDWELKDRRIILNDNEAKARLNRGGDDLFDMLKDQLTGKIDSWAIRFCYAHSVNGKYALLPVRSLVNNIGSDGTGTHRGNNAERITEEGKDNLDRFELEEGLLPDEKVIKAYRYAVNRLTGNDPWNRTIRSAKSAVRRLIRVNK
ncbi:MAG TPA: sugar transferase [Candidatus Omnitrophota bacterium]|nr:sugar transferase [Candidatus Omnitrophota bacterium]